MYQVTKYPFQNRTWEIGINMKKTLPNRGEKRWVKRKGCKNCAKQWVIDYIDDEGVEYGTWLIVPMVVGKPFTYVTKEFNLIQQKIENVYFNKKGNLVFNKKDPAHV